MRSPASSAGKPGIPTPAPTSNRRTSWSTRCAAGSARGRAFASTCSTCRSRRDRHRNRSIQTTTWTTGAASPTPQRGAEDLLELVRSRNLELIVAAGARRLVQAPALKDRGVTEPVSLHVVVLHLTHAFDPQRLPRQVLAGTPPALTARHASRLLALSLGPFAPRMIVHRPLPQWLELHGELATRR